MATSPSTELSEGRNSSAVPLPEIARLYADHPSPTESPLSYLGPRRKHDTGVPQLSGADHATPLLVSMERRQGLREDACVCHVASGPRFSRVITGISGGTGAGWPVQCGEWQFVGRGNRGELGYTHLVSNTVVSWWGKILYIQRSASGTFEAQCLRRFSHNFSQI